MLGPNSWTAKMDEKEKPKDLPSIISRLDRLESMVGGGSSNMAKALSALKEAIALLNKLYDEGKIDPLEIKTFKDKYEV